MKIGQEHFEYLASKYATFLKAYPEAQDQYRAMKLSDKRYRWDFTHVCGLTKWICDNLYSYLDDTHIDTALRAITGTK